MKHKPIRKKASTIILNTNPAMWKPLFLYLPDLNLEKLMQLKIKPNTPSMRVKKL